MSREILTRIPPDADERIAYGTDPSQYGELRLPPGNGPHPAVIYVHGGCWLSEYDLRHAGHACAGLTEAGFATWSLEYRRLGATGGGWPATFLDVARGADHLREIARGRRIDLDRVLVAGHSAGGHLALWLAARRRLTLGTPLFTADPLPLRGALSLAGVVDLEIAAQRGLCGGAVQKLLGGSPDEVPDRYRAASPYALLPLGIPQVLVHGREDKVIPVEVSVRYQAHAMDAGDDADLVMIDGTGHFELGDPLAPAFDAVRRAAIRLVA